MRTSQRGFTLVELLIVMAVVAILAAIAYPSYTEHIMRSHRRAAQSQMMDIANRQQQFLLANRMYATQVDLQASGYALPADVADRYTYSVAVAGGGAVAPTFTITFTPKGAQSGDGSLTLNNEGVKSPSNKW